MTRVLIIIPHDRFSDEDFESTYNLLVKNNYCVQIGSTHHTEARGSSGLIVSPDINIPFVEPRDYDVYIFIGGEGVKEYINDSSIHNLIRNIYQEGKIIAASGLAVELLIYAGTISRKRVTAPASIITIIEASGAYYTGRSVELDGNIITATGARTSDDFAENILGAISSKNPESDRR